LGTITGPPITIEQLALILVTLPPDDVRLILSLLTGPEARALLALLPPGFFPVLPSGLPRTGGGIPWAALAGVGAGLFAFGVRSSEFGVRRRRR
jgi:hypothetical protein